MQQKKKTKQNKKILSLSAQCFGFSVYSYPTRCCFRYAIKKRSLMFKTFSGELVFVAWRGTGQSTQKAWILQYFNH